MNAEAVPAFRVLFIDHEQPVLDALRRRLHAYRQRWDMGFVSSSEDAIAWARDGVDMVLCDLHMPDSGEHLLEIFRQQFPAAIRVLFTERTETDRVMQSIGPAHRYLPKPCTVEEIEDTLGRALTLRNYLAHPSFAAILGAITRGPLFPSKFSELLDPMRERLRGLDLREAQLLSAKILEQLSVGTAEGVDTNAYWHQATVVAECVEQICEWTRAPSAMRTHAIMAAYLHNLGALLIARYGKDAAWDARTDAPLAEDAIAAYVLGLWGLPDAVVEAVAFHRVPSRTSSAAPSAHAILHAAWTRLLPATTDFCPPAPGVATGPQTTTAAAGSR